MKILLLIIISTLTSTVYCQTESKLYEKAYFEAKHNNETAYITSFTSRDEGFSNDDFNQMKTTFFQKEGFFKVEISGDKTKIDVYHLSFIDAETIKGFVTPIKEAVDFKEAVIFTF